MPPSVEPIRIHLSRVIEAIQAVPADRLDAEDRQVGVGLTLLARAHQKVLEPSNWAALAPDQQKFHADHAQQFCVEVDELLVASLTRPA